MLAGLKSTRVIGSSAGFNSVHTRGIVKKRGFTRVFVKIGVSVQFKSFFQVEFLKNRSS